MRADKAGASARREYERRRANDEARLRAKWGRFGGIAVALSDERRSTRAWKTGADGEARVGARLDRLASPSIRILHDRRVPGGRANFDHIAVTSAGVWVIDTKNYTGRPALRVEGGFLRARAEFLMISGRNKTPLVEGVLRQKERLRTLLPPGLPLHGSLCFTGADWPLFAGPFFVRGVEVLWPAKLETRLRATIGNDLVDVEAVAARLDAALQSA